jgi:hypothetical protein
MDRAGHEHGCRHAGCTRGIGDRDAVIAARGGDQTRLPPRLIQQRQPAERAARLEAARDLQRIELEHDLARGRQRPVHGCCGEQRRAAHERGDAARGRLDVVERDHAPVVAANPCGTKGAADAAAAPRYAALQKRGVLLGGLHG